MTITPPVANNPPEGRLLGTLAMIASIWVVSDLGYYFLLPLLGVKASYNVGSVAITLYYIFWIGIAIITFWDFYSRWTKFDNRIASYAIWSIAFGGCTLFAAYLLPLFPPTHWLQPWNPPDVAVATEWYFLPKSVEILFQQLLIVALVLSLSARGYEIRKISLYCAALFGGTHLLLAFGGVPLGYVVRFMVFAALFGLIFPYLILRLPNGLGYSYMLHWLYYAITVVMPRIFSSPPAA
jgi:hypothetical protein